MVIPDHFEPFESPKLLVESAKASVAKFEEIASVFREICTYTVVIKDDLQTSEKVYSAKFDQKIPGSARTTSNSILADLRHALDQAVCDASISLASVTASNTYFPFSKDQGDLANEIKRKCKKVDKGIIAHIERLKPYLGGNDKLWALSKAAGISKHQRLLNIGLESRGVVLGGAGFKSLKGPATIVTDRWSALKNEREFLRIGPGGHLDGNLVLPIQIIIGDAEVIGGQPAVAVFHDFVSMVEGIVLGVEAEMARILASRS